jgi:pyridoxal 5'-phosphate synthase pdxT subunit
LIKTIGILALQGDYAKHAEVVRKLKYNLIFVRDASGLNKCDALIIPGGESTTFLNLIEKLALRKPLLDFGQKKAIMGTCAGLIILASKTDSLEFEPLKLIDIEIHRNAYGRQINSFIDEIDLKINGAPAKFEGVFIRAPKIISINDRVQPLAYYGDDIVMAANKNVLVATFHPELTDDFSIHKYFIEKFVS